MIIAHRRTHYLARSLVSVLRPWAADPANAARFPLYVSVDDGANANSTFFASALNYATGLQGARRRRAAQLGLRRRARAAAAARRCRCLTPC